MRIWMIVAGIAFWTGVLLLALPTRSAGASATLEIGANVPLACEASIETFEIVSAEPLRIAVGVRQSCNSTHAVSVTYDPDDLSQPGQLSMVYGERQPVASAPGEVSFGTFRHTQSLTRLYIAYDGGTRDEREQLSRTIAIALTPQ